MAPSSVAYLVPNNTLWLRCLATLSKPLSSYNLPSAVMRKKNHLLQVRIR